MTARSQGHPKYQPQTPSSQLLRERQKFFEDVLEHDVDLRYPQIHFLSDRWRPPLDSVSSMEVNIDSLELSEPLDISELDTSDAFQQSDDPISPLTPPADLQNISWSRLHFPASLDAAHDVDSADRAKESPCEQCLEQIKPDVSISDSTHCDHTKTTVPELQ
ncbi:dysbindin domain-containing protein 2-like [Pelodytes ibericus]